ncbi:hypothetical protein SGLAM104S_06919 [Streptomyces glaucescens]
MTHEQRHPDPLNPDEGGTTEVADAKGTTTRINTSPDQDRVTTEKVDSIAAQVPEEIRARGTLEIVDSSGSAAPLTFHATDNKTVIGVEPDLAYLVADVLGLKPHFNTVSWENIFVGLDSAKYDVGFSNITVTEERKEKYDFATYREDNLGFEAKKGSGLKVDGPEDVAGRTVAVGSGTNQEKLLIEWSEANEKAGREPVDIKYYQNDSDTYLALKSTAGSTSTSAPTRPPPTTRPPPAGPRSWAPAPAALASSRASSPPPPRRTAAW